MLLVPATQHFLVEKSNLKSGSVYIVENKAGAPYSYHATVSLDAKIQGSSLAAHDVVEIWTFQVQECIQSSWHELEKYRDDEISNGDFLLVEEVVVQAIQIDDVRVAGWYINGQLGIVPEVSVALHFVVGYHHC